MDLKEQFYIFCVSEAHHDLISCEALPAFLQALPECIGWQHSSCNKFGLVAFTSSTELIAGLRYCLVVGGNCVEQMLLEEVTRAVLS